MRMFENTKIVPLVSPQSLASTSTTGTYYQPQDVDRATINVAIGAMTKDDTVTVEIFEAKDASGTDAKAIPIGSSYVVPGVPQKVTIDHTAAPDDGTSLKISGMGVSAEDKFQLWFNEGGTGSAPSPAAGYTLKGPVLAASFDTQQHINTFMTAQFSTEITAIKTGNNIQFVNAKKGAVTAPADVDTDLDITIDQVGTNDATVQPELEYIYTSVGVAATPEVITIPLDPDNFPADGKSFGFSTISSAGAEVKYLWPFNTDGTTGSVTPVAGYTAVTGMTANDISTPQYLNDYVATNFNDEIKVTYTKGELTIYNVYPGAVTAPNNNDSGVVAIVNHAGSNLSTAETQPPSVMLDFSLRYMDLAHSFKYFTTKITTSATITVSAQAIMYEMKHSRESVPAGLMW